MSNKRKIKVAYELDILEKVAKELHYETSRNTTVRGYNGANIGKADLVISTYGDTYDIGFKRTENGTEMIYDNHQKIADRKLKEILPAYIQRKTKVGFTVEKILKESNQTKIYVRR